MAINLQDLKSTFDLDTNPLRKSSLLAVAGIGAIVAGIAIAAKKIVEFTDLASDLAETVSKTTVVFGENSKEILEWSKTSAKALGMSKEQALAGAATFGNLFRAMKIGEPISAKMSKSLVELAADLASFNNLDPTEVLDKLRAGLIGEAEPLRSLGVNLTAATVEAKALELGLWDGVGAIDASAKAQAAYAIILEQTSLAQGDFARTSEGLANQERISAALWEDAKTNIGTKFLPAITEARKKLNQFLEVLADPDLDANKVIGKIDEFVGIMLNGFANSINNWVAGGGAETLTNNLVSWIETVGTDEATKSKMQMAAERLVEALGNALREVDWTQVNEAMGERIDNMFDANRPRGEDAIADFFDALEVAGTDATRNMLLNFQAEIWKWVNTNLPNIFKTGGVMAANSLSMGWLSRIFEFIANLNNFQSQADDKLRTIAKTFFNRGLGWAQQAARGFRDGIGTILSTVESIVGLINGILRKIKTHFNITFSFSTGVSDEFGGFDFYDEHGSDDRIGGRATGGSVTAGQVYKVNELGRPEYFIPTMDGRVSPTSTQSNPPTVLADESIDALGMIFKQLVLKGTNA